jgi:hypothetical protein
MKPAKPAIIMMDAADSIAETHATIKQNRRPCKAGTSKFRSPPACTLE